jgi:hypothetical protein
MSTHLVEGIISLRDRGFSTSAHNATNGILNLKKGLLKATAAIGGLTVAFGQIKKGFESAINLGEVQNVVDTTFNKSAKTIDNFSKTAIEKFGLSELQAKKFGSTLGAMLKSAGVTGNDLTNMSTKLTGMAGDLASFYNLDHDEAFDKIRSGIIGSTEPLQSLGINMSVANLEAFALQKGLKKQYKSMSESERMTLRYNFIMEKAKDANGDFAKTLDGSVSNQLRVAKNQWDSIRANLAKGFLPALLNVTKALNKMLGNFDKLKQKISGFYSKIKETQAFKNFNNNLKKIKENLEKAFTKTNIDNVVKNTSEVFKNLKETYGDIDKGIKDNLIPRFKELIDLIKPTLITTMDELKTTTENNKGAFEKFGEFTKSNTIKAIELLGQSMGGLNKVAEQWSYSWNQLVFPVLNGLYNEFLGLVEYFSGVFKPVFSFGIETIGKRVSGLGTTFGGVIRLITDVLTGLIKTIQGTFTADWALAWDGVKQIFVGVWYDMQSIFEPVINRFIDKINFVIELASKIPLVGKGLKGFKIDEFKAGSYTPKETLNFIPNSIKKNTTNNSNKTTNITINGSRMTNDEMGRVIRKQLQIAQNMY